MGGVEAGVDVVELRRAEEGEGEVDGWNLTSRAEESNCHTETTVNQVKREEKRDERTEEKQEEKWSRYTRGEERGREGERRGEKGGKEEMEERILDRNCIILRGKQ